MLVAGVLDAGEPNALHAVNLRLVVQHESSVGAGKGHCDGGRQGGGMGGTRG